MAVMAARQAPHLRVFRNDHPTRASIALRLVGTSGVNDLRHMLDMALLTGICALCAER